MGGGVVYRRRLALNYVDARIQSLRPLFFYHRPLSLRTQTSALGYNLAGSRLEYKRSLLSGADFQSVFAALFLLGRAFGFESTADSR